MKYMSEGGDQVWRFGNCLVYVWATGEMALNRIGEGGTFADVDAFEESLLMMCWNRVV